MNLLQFVPYEAFEKNLLNHIINIQSYINKLEKIEFIKDAEDLKVFINDNIQTLDDYIYSYNKINKEIQQFRDSCKYELEVIANLLSFIEIDDPTVLKYPKDYEIILDNVLLINPSFNVNDIKKKLFKNFIFRNFIHQTNICLTLILPTIIKNNFNKQLDSNIIIKESSFYLNKLRQYKEQTNRFIRELKVIGQLKQKDKIHCDQIYTKDLFQYLENFRTSNSPFLYFNKSTKVEFFFNECTNQLFKSDLFKIQEIIDVILVNACEELSLAMNDINYNRNPFVKFDLTINNSTLIFSIFDNGRGVQNEEILYEYNKSTKASFGSSGIGLYAINKIVSKLNGKIDFVSTYEGTKFTISLPIEV